MTENKSYRKFDKCQKCGETGEAFTSTHRFAKYCKNCNPKAVASGVVKKTKSGERMLSENEFFFRFHEWSLAVKCVNCNREIDIISGRTQDFEAFCPGCNRHYVPVFGVKEIVTKDE